LSPAVHEEETRAALIPTLMSFAVVIAALPGLALIWGARVTDLTELWTRMARGLLAWRNPDHAG
jgi:potassium efflux system protein